MRGRPRKCDDVAREFSQMYANGETSTTIAEKYNVHPGTVIRYLREMGVTVRKQGSSNRQRMRTLVRDKGKVVMRKKLALYPELVGAARGLRQAQLNGQSFEFAEALAHSNAVLAKAEAIERGECDGMD